MKKVYPYIKIFFVLSAVFVLTLTAVFCIPQSAINGNAEKSLTVIHDELADPVSYFGYAPGMIDSYTDMIMISSCNVNEDTEFSPLQLATDVNNYSRYWHGYLIILRPLLIFADYIGIRYINMFLIICLLCITASLISKRLGTAACVSFVISQIAVFIAVVPFCMHYMNIFILTFIFSILILEKKQRR